MSRGSRIKRFVNNTKREIEKFEETPWIQWVKNGIHEKSNFIKVSINKFISTSTKNFSTERISIFSRKKVEIHIVHSSLKDLFNSNSIAKL